MDEKSLKPSPFALRNLLTTVLIITFFIIIIIIYYVMLYTATKQNIIKEGELNAVYTATQIDNYLTTGSEIIKLTSYTLDHMLQDGVSQAEIQTYLNNQTTAAKDTMPGNVSTIYAYINGQFLNGAGWEPEPDFIPEQRPWFQAAMEQPGKLVVVDPYVDAMTGDTMITLSKLLSDGSSVAAIDFTVTPLQEIIEEVAAQDHSTEIVLNHSYQVIAHSDKSEIGKSFAEPSDTLTSAIVQRLPEMEEHYMALRYGGAEYIVYVTTVDNDWVCLSITDATTILRDLQVPLILSVIGSLLILFILFMVMVDAHRKNKLAVKLKEFADQQTAYAYHDQMTGLKNRRSYAEALENIAQFLPADICVITADVNGLKQTNDTLGHDAGDELICGAADCLNKCFMNYGDIFRIGGDEFIALLNIPEEELAKALDKLNDELEDWCGDLVNILSVSVGCAHRREFPEADITELARISDERMYEQKNEYYRLRGIDRRKNND